MAEQLNVELRETRGKRNARRNRRAGKLPAVLYGHGQEAISLALSAEPFEAAVRHGARLVKLTGAVDEQAFIREIQWDTWGTHVLHVDFTRISEHEKVEVRVPVEIRGEAPGLKAGGV
ncbi:MAG: 50S ribosomal protein L25, partial [Gemmataceae bacterium]|nr:50S ribosomal protein L25 [Gemmataceae bacterium]